eukprot:2148540-Amphidinium_carterae.2
MELAGWRKGIPSLHFKISLKGPDNSPLQSLTTRHGLHFSKARTTAKNSALKTDCWQPGSGSQTRSP